MSADESLRRLTRVGPGTEMGALLRRYWHPIAALPELERDPLKPIRLFGEDLLLYKDRSGTLGLVDRHCPHRGADLLYGIVEPRGLRCSYHGWHFDERGRCLERPFEETVRPNARCEAGVDIRAYPVAVKASLVWAYLGPPPAPCLWDWARFYDPGHPVVSLAQLPCNWLQCQENTVDPVHVEWLHQALPGARYGHGERGARHRKLGFDEFEFGFVYRRVLDNTDESHPLWTVGRASLWPNGFFTGAFFWHVPVDDHATLQVSWRLDPSAKEPTFRHVELERGPDGRYDVRNTQYQDSVAMIGQGTIADRSREHLGASDRGVILLRRRLLAELDRLAAGGEPKAILRDEARNHRIPLPFTALHPEQQFGSGPSPRARRKGRGLLARSGPAAPSDAKPVGTLQRAKRLGKRGLRRLRRSLRRPVSPSGGPDVAAMLRGYRLSALLYVVARLRVADALSAAPRSAEELAGELGAHGPSVARILRALAAHGLFTQEGERFGLTAAGERLCTDARDSLHGTALLIGEEFMPAWLALLHTARTGETAFDHVFGMSNWEHRRLHPDLDAAFNRGSVSGAERNARRATEVFDFSQFRRVVDVGGGTGLFLGRLLLANPRLRGTLFDQPHVVAAAPANLARLGVEDRCDVEGGDFFATVPDGADAYLLKHVLHDWDDERALAILRACRRALGAGDGRLLVLESILPERGIAGRRELLLDIHMLAVDGGRERSEAEFRALLAAGGFAIERVHPLSGSLSLLEARATDPHAASPPDPPA